MPARIRIPLAALLLVTMACNAVMQTWRPASTPAPDPGQLQVGTSPAITSTPAATAIFTSSATASPLPPTPTPTQTPSPTPRPTSAPIHVEIFEELWQVINEDYLYADFNGLDWNAIHAEYLHEIEAGLSPQDFYLAMDEMVYRLGDDHSVFLSPEEAAEESAEFAGEFEYAGIGAITSSVPDRQRVVIVLVFPGSPAEEAGLQIHDSILEIDGQPVLGEDGQRQASLRGPEGSTVTLTVQTPGYEPRRVILARQIIDSIRPVPYQVFSTGAGKRIGYLLLTTFYDLNVPNQVEKALRAMSAEAPLDGLILDNRQNEGGASTVINSTLAFFTSGRMGYFVNRHAERPVRVISEDLNGSQKLPLVVLIGRETYSFGEIFAGILKDLGRAFLIGERTDGNVEILYDYEFADGSRAWIAHDIFRPFNNPDQDWEQTGIIPDLEAPSEWDLITMDSDPAIKAALNYFDGI